MQSERRIRRLEKRESAIIGKVFAQMTNEELEVIADREDWQSVKPVRDRYVELWWQVVRESQP